jgi:hypothetical protein
MGNSFEEYLKGKLTAVEFVDGLKDLFGSPHRRTKVLENPRIVTHKELLELAELLNVQPLTLFMEYKVAFGTLSQREVEQLQFVFLTVAPDKQAAIRYIEEKEKAIAA